MRSSHQIELPRREEVELLDRYLLLESQLRNAGLIALGLLTQKRVAHLVLVPELLSESLILINVVGLFAVRVKF